MKRKGYADHRLSEHDSAFMILEVSTDRSEAIIKRYANSVWEILSIPTVFYFEIEDLELRSLSL